MRKRPWLLFVLAIVGAGIAALAWESCDDTPVQQVGATAEQPTMRFDIAEALPDEPATAERDRVRMGRSLAVYVRPARKGRVEYFAQLPSAVGMGPKLLSDKHYGLDAYAGRRGETEILAGHSERLGTLLIHECRLDKTDLCTAYAWAEPSLEVRYVFNRSHLDDWRQILDFVLARLAGHSP
jgi:hypothetical protein